MTSMKFIQFGGQGVPWLKEFSSYYSNKKLEKFYSTVIESIQEEIPKVKEAHHVAIPNGFDIHKWLEDISNFNSNDYLTTATISLSMIQATQLAHIEYLHQEGFERKKLLENVPYISGHSQGIITACFLGMQLDDDKYYEVLKHYMKFIFYLGIRAQQSFPYIVASNEENESSQNLGTSNPAPMVAILGESHSFVEELVQQFNHSNKENTPIYIGLYNSPNNRILCSSRKTLILFNKFIKNHIEEKKLKFIYLKASCPFHSPLMTSILPLIENDIKNNFYFPYTGADLKIPVYSFSDGRNLQQDSNLAISLCKELMVNTLDWSRVALKVNQDPDINEIYDIGPSKITQRLTSEFTSKPIVNLTLAKEQKKMLDSF